VGSCRENNLTLSFCASKDGKISISYPGWRDRKLYAAPASALVLDDSGQYLRAREAEAMCDDVWIFEARTLSTQGRH
jgi:hypothetical protein